AAAQALQRGRHDAGVIARRHDAPLGIEELAQKERQTVYRARRLERFLTQPFFTTEQFNSIPGQWVSLEDALAGCDRILNDEFTDTSEQALYMIGAAPQIPA
ncbi:MAG: hypothetical protein AAFR42_09135, partial [Cyanobacteria bacterium J06628_6]